MKLDRCDICYHELTYYGEMTSDGPSLDCSYCQLTQNLKEKEQILETLRTTLAPVLGMAAKNDDKKVIDLVLGILEIIK